MFWSTLHSKYLEKMKYDVFEERERAGKTIDIVVNAGPTRLMESSGTCINIQS